MNKIGSLFQHQDRRIHSRREDVMELSIPVDITDEAAEALARDPRIMAVVKALQQRSSYPRQWDNAATSYPYERYEANNGWHEDVETSLPSDGVTFKICADCGTKVWIRIGDREHHLSMRMSSFLIIAPNLQVKATRSALLVLRTHPISGAQFCHAAAD